MKRPLDLDQLAAELNDLEARYQAWAVPINRAMREGMRRINQGGYTAKDYAGEIAKVQEAQRAVWDPYEEMYALLDELCPAYLAAGDRERERIRKLAADKRGLISALLGYVYRAAKRVRAGEGEKALMDGLAAASIENCRVDYRDALLALAELYVAAEEVGMRPRSAFRRVATLSSEATPRGGPTPMSEVLARFHSYGALRERRGRIKRRK